MAVRTAGPESFAIVVPTIGRPSLDVLLAALSLASGPEPAWIVVVDDRPLPFPPLRIDAGRWSDRVVVRQSVGRGPAGARNLGWRTVPDSTPWIVFLDDDVVVGPRWFEELADDLAACRRGGCVASQARIDVPLPTGRRAKDAERGTAGLAGAAWITADMAYRRDVLVAVGGFDERFRRAYREDADLALRVLRTGGRLARGRRVTTHPVRPQGFWASVRAQKGNADDVLMTRLHGRRWRDAVLADRGTLHHHQLAVACALVGASGLLLGRRGATRAGFGLWAALTAEFAWRRVVAGPRDPEEVARMLVTSAVIPFAASAHHVRGLVAHRAVAPWRAVAQPHAGTPRAVLFDRDGTLVVDVPYNADASKVRAVAGAQDVVAGLRRRGIAVGVVTNQSGVARHRITAAELAAVNARVDELFGGFDVWCVCTHAPEDACACRKPLPGLVLEAASKLGVRVEDVVVVGDIGADVDAALSAGARAAVLVPTSTTAPEEIRRAPVVAADLAEAVRLTCGAMS
jgi:histidinol-phosphate phosphatase family protein